MKIEVVAFLMLSCFAHHLATAQPELDWLLNQAEFRPILKAHLKETRENKRDGCSIVSTITFSYRKDTLIVNLSAIASLTELQDDLPDSLITIAREPVLIYDGSVGHTRDQQKWFKTAKAFVGDNLCNNLTYLNLLKQPGPKEIPVPSCCLYHTPVNVSLFSKGHLIKHMYKLKG